jgi:hypothetical protein
LNKVCKILSIGFLLTDTWLVLPAFGTFTAGQVIKPTPGQTLYPIAKQTVFHCPGG